MKLLFDENIHNSVINHFKDKFEVYSVSELSKGISDDKVLNLAADFDAILITADKDFGSLTFREKLNAATIILIRISSVLPRDIIHSIEKTFNNVKSFQNKFIVVSDEKIRIRES